MDRGAKSGIEDLRASEPGAGRPLVVEFPQGEWGFQTFGVRHRAGPSFVA
jgi:hypothetical protein